MGNKEVFAAGARVVVTRGHFTGREGTVESVGRLGCTVTLDEDEEWAFFIEMRSS